VSNPVPFLCCNLIAIAIVGHVTSGRSERWAPARRSGPLPAHEQQNWQALKQVPPLGMRVMIRASGPPDHQARFIAWLSQYTTERPPATLRKLSGFSANILRNPVGAILRRGRLAPSASKTWCRSSSFASAPSSCATNLEPPQVEFSGSCRDHNRSPPK